MMGTASTPADCSVARSARHRKRAGRTPARASALVVSPMKPSRAQPSARCRQVWRPSASRRGSGAAGSTGDPAAAERERTSSSSRWWAGASPVTSTARPEPPRASSSRCSRRAPPVSRAVSPAAWTVTRTGRREGAAGAASTAGIARVVQSPFRSQRTSPAPGSSTSSPPTGNQRPATAQPQQARGPASPGATVRLWVERRAVRPSTPADSSSRANAAWLAWTRLTPATSTS